MNKFKKAAVMLAGVFLSVFVLVNTAYASSYTVVANDSLYKIGTLFNTSANAIMQANNLNSSVIHPGQVLQVNAVTYTVKAGDSLYLISKRYGVTLYELRKANNKWNDRIVTGQKLVIPVIPAASGTSGTVTTNSGSAAKIPYTQSDLNLLARLITAEADSQPYAAKVGVGAVVVNRVINNTFPNSISSVIYQKDARFYQFTPVENGLINKPASDSSAKAAYDALHGADPSNGSLFYFDDSTTNQWLWSKPIRARIGRMVFVY